jgi:membrane protease YdiL (CAAX protease family)
MASTASSPSPKWYGPESRALSAIEFIVGASIVIAYNVFRIIPNEVYILVVLGLLSVRLRNGSLSAMGFKRPESWTRIVLIALGAAALRILLGAVVIEPLTEQFWPPATLPSEAEGVTGNITKALLLLLLVWSFAAFGEEISYRGYLLLRAADVGRRTTAAYWVGIVLVSVLFGYGHYYKGPSGIIDSGVAGLIYGAAFMLASRNLWASILAHGFINTFGVIVLYFGWDS